MLSEPSYLQILVSFFMFMVVFVPLERWLSLRQQRVFRPGWTTDVIHYTAGFFLNKFTTAISIGSMFLIRQLTGFNSTSIVASQPVLFQFFEILVIADFLGYLSHRAFHYYFWLWRCHIIHHSSERMDWLANSRLHPFDKILADCIQFTPIFCLGFTNSSILAFTIFLGFQGCFNHSNIKVDFGPLRSIIVSPEFHHWHHCDDPKAYNKNFAPHLVIFDVLFGTAYFPPHRSLPKKYGVSQTVPRGFLGQIIYPFYLKKRMVPNK